MPQNKQPTIAELTAELQATHRRHLAALEVLTAVEQLLDVGIVGRAGQTVTVTASALDDLQDQFDAWRALVEANSPPHWQVAE